MADETMGGISEFNELNYRLSWVAYFRPILSFVAMLFFTFIILGEKHFPAISLIGSFLFLFTIYRFMVLRSYLLFFNDQGVWVYSGVLPWFKGIGGVRWRDVEEAQYSPGFFGWVFGSHTVKVNHRFTGEYEIVLPFVRHGDEAVGIINTLHGSYLYGDVE